MRMQARPHACASSVKVPARCTLRDQGPRTLALLAGLSLRRPRMRAPGVESSHVVLVRCAEGQWRAGALRALSG